jgi:hypothetical protein
MFLSIRNVGFVGALRNIFINASTEINSVSSIVCNKEILKSVKATITSSSLISCRSVSIVKLNTISVIAQSVIESKPQRVIKSKASIDSSANISANTSKDIKSEANIHCFSEVTGKLERIIKGQALFTHPSTFSDVTYTWVVPEGVTSVSVVCVGGGGSGSRDFNNPIRKQGGGGGGLGWKNNIPVVPGQSYTVVVGRRGSSVTPDNYPGRTDGFDGGDSYFISSELVAGFGGKAGTLSSTDGNGLGGGFVGDGGGNGGNALSGTTSSTFGGGGGGGAGGYTGNGGQGGKTQVPPNQPDSATDGQGGGGGGGAGELCSPSKGGGGGGGVGVLGAGANGTRGISNSGSCIVEGGGGGSGGIDGGDAILVTMANLTKRGYGGEGGNYGGGSGYGVYGSLAGGQAAVRIIYPGEERQFPSTRTADE